MARRQIDISGWRLGAVSVFVVCGVLLMISAQASRGSDLRSDDRVELADLVRHQNQENQELSGRVDELNTLIEELRQTSSTTESNQVQDAIAEVSGAAGVTPVTGPGVKVELSDAEMPDEVPPELNIEDYLVHQQDVEGVLNALRAGGAEAIMVKGQRIVSTTSVRCVGPVLLINGRTYYQPYTIQAIGNALDLQDGLDESPAVSAYRNQAEVIGLGYEMDVQEEITMPAYDGGLGVSVGQ